MAWLFRETEAHGGYAGGRGVGPLSGPISYSGIFGGFSGRGCPGPASISICSGRPFYIALISSSHPLPPGLS